MRGREPFFASGAKIGVPCLPEAPAGEDAAATSERGRPMHRIAIQRISLFATAAAFVFLAGIVVGVI
jgi:hypothetical protein